MDTKTLSKEEGQENEQDAEEVGDGGKGGRYEDMRTARGMRWVGEDGKMNRGKGQSEG